MGDDTSDGPLRATVCIDDETVDALLREGQVEIVGRMPWSSNGTYLVVVDDGTDRTPAVYKPESGERPLWDFPSGLWRREVAAAELSKALSWDVVPPTVARDDAPMGPGSLQFFVHADFDQHYFTLRDDPAHLERLRRICLLDIIANNTDRKSGHCLLGLDGRVWAIDNGLSFHRDFKVRTVLWDYGGERLASAEAGAVSTLVETGLPGAVVGLLCEDERDAVLDRARRLLNSRRFPIDPTGRCYPWPLI